VRPAPRQGGDPPARAGVVIPAYNAAGTLPAVLERLPDLALERLWIVNDGSTDGTGLLARRLVEHADPRWRRAELIDSPRNRGYGAAMKRGLHAARAAGLAVTICVHADGQYAPEELPAMIAGLTRRRLDILQGSRLAAGWRGARGGGMPLYKLLCGQALTRLENRVLGLQMTDYHSGYMAFSRRALATIRFEELSDSFDFDLEMIAAAVALGLSVGERPIPTHYGDEVSHLDPLRYGLRVLWVMFKYLQGRYHRLSNPS
jgi:glycosyltransferase involved in cell wall biosynthesis